MYDKVELARVLADLKSTRASIRTAIHDLEGILSLEFELTCGQTAIISTVDYELLRFGWCAQKHTSGDYYAATTKRIDGKSKKLYLHRLVFERMIGRTLGKGEEVDHIDLNKLNCCRDNLRLATHTQNNHNKGLHSKNKSGYTGVHWAKQIGRWVAYITVDRKRIHLGTFDTAEEAKIVRDEATRHYYGEFGRVE